MDLFILKEILLVVVGVLGAVFALIQFCWEHISSSRHTGVKKNHRKISLALAMITSLVIITYIGDSVYLNIVTKNSVEGILNINIGQAVLIIKDAKEPDQYIKDAQDRVVGYKTLSLGKSKITLKDLKTFKRYSFETLVTDESFSYTGFPSGLYQIVIETETYGTYMNTIELDTQNAQSDESGLSWDFTAFYLTPGYDEFRDFRIYVGDNIRYVEHPLFAVTSEGHTLYNVYCLFESDADDEGYLVGVFTGPAYTYTLYNAYEPTMFEPVTIIVE